MHEFERAWSEFKPTDGANLLMGDDVLRQLEYSILNPSWESLIRQEEFGVWDRRLHLSLLPQPFFGNLSAATVFVLALNPGLHPIDYFAEFFRPEYREALADTLQQRLSGKDFPFIWFDPQFCWHSGFSYWHGRFASLIDAFKEEFETSRVQALSFFAKSVAVLELLPYHSASFGIPSRVLEGLRSVELARGYVSDVLVPRAKSGDAVLVATRQGKLWSLPNHKNVTVYEGAETRAAYLGSKSRGGEAIIEHLRARRRGLNP